MAVNPPPGPDKDWIEKARIRQIEIDAAHGHNGPFGQAMAGKSFPPPSKTEPGLRYDSGKPRYDLIPVVPLDDLAALYEYGAKKYAERNWEKGMSWGRCFASLMRHAWAFWRGENYDVESGFHHMTHVAWNAMALVEYSKRALGTDDRVFPPNKIQSQISEAAPTSDASPSTPRYRYAKHQSPPLE